SVICMLVSLVPAFVIIHPGGTIEIRTIESIELMRSKNYRSFYLSSAALFIFLAAGKYLDRFALLLSQSGAVAGAGWTDANIRLPALSIVMAVTALAGIMILIPKARRSVQDRLWKWRITNHPAPPL